MAGLSQIIALLAACVLAAGCGGGADAGTGSSTSTTTSTTSTTLAPDSGRGLYEGTASNGHYFNTLVLDDNRYYIIYGTLFNEDFLVDGLMSGSGSAGAGGFVSADLRDFPAGGMVFLGNMNAAYIPGIRFDATVNRSAQAIAFDGSVLPPARYRYDTPALLSDIVGAWSLRDLQGFGVALEVQPNGGFMAAAGACRMSGSLTPRPGSGGNVFDARIDFGAAPCVQAGLSETGHALSYLRASGARQFILVAPNAGRSAATVLAGVR